MYLKLAYKSYLTFIQSYDYLFIDGETLNQFIIKSFLYSLAIIFSVHYCYFQLPEIKSRSNISCMMGGVGENEARAKREEAKNGL